MDYALKLKALRKAKGLTQTQLAVWLTERSGQTITQRMVTSWERGQISIPLPKLILRELRAAKF